MAFNIPPPDKISLADGTSVSISRTPGMGAQEWNEFKKYLEENPEEARMQEMWSKDSKAVKAWLQKQALEDFYGVKLNSSDDATGSKLAALEQNPEFAQVFEDVKRGGAQAAIQHSYNEPLMMKVSRAVGGVPEEVKEAISKIAAFPVTLQEACKMGDIKAVEDYLALSAKIDEPDAKGITCLGYAIGANRTGVVKLLLEEKADPSKCDMSGCTAVHYAAAYGRKELLTCFLNQKLDVNAKNVQGQTPLALATRNKQKETIEILKSKGGTL